MTPLAISARRLRGKHRRGVAVAVHCCAWLAAFAPPCVAADQDDTRKPTTLAPLQVRSSALPETVISVATKSASSILESPQASSVVSARFMRAIGARSVAEALGYTAGVRSQAFGSDPRIDYYQIRGFATSTLYQDGLLLLGNGFSQWATPAQGIERLEVLRGPASVLYGGSGAGGLVNVRTRAADGRELRRYGIGIDQRHSRYLHADYGTAPSPRWALRAVGLLRDGRLQNGARDDRAFAALALRWTPSSDWSLAGRVSLQRDRAERPTGFLPYDGTVVALPYGRIPATLFVSDHGVDAYDRDQREVGYEVTWHPDAALEFRQKARYAELDLHYAGLYGLFTGNPLPGRPRLLARGHASLRSHQRNLTVDNQWHLELGTDRRHALTLGLDVSANALDNRNRAGRAPPLDVLAPDNRQPLPGLGAAEPSSQRLDAVGAYLQDQWHPTEAWVVSLATRRDYLAVRSRSARAGSTRDHTARQRARVGVVWLAAHGLAPYLSYSTFFTPLVGMVQATGVAFRPETGDQREVGLRFAPDDSRWLLTSAVFDLVRDGVPVASPVAGFPRNQVQAGRLRSRGVELELEARPSEGLALHGAYTRLRVTTLDGAPGSVGRWPTATPGTLASAHMDYRWRHGPLTGVGVGLGLRHVGRSYADARNVLPVPASTVWDLALRYRHRAWEAALHLDNLFDRRYVAACAAPGTCYYAGTRRATLSLDYRL
jgi:iron complex outermembrane receptor protein